jgi:hypothetical protein
MLACQNRRKWANHFRLIPYKPANTEKLFSSPSRDRGARSELAERYFHAVVIRNGRFVGLLPRGRGYVFASRHAE